MYFKRVKQFFRYLIRSIARHNVGALAAVIAFFGFSAMIPLALLLIYGTSIFFVQHAVVQNFLLNVLKSYVPTIPEAKVYLTQNVTRLALLNANVGLFGGIGLLWTTVGGFVSLQRILDVIWEVRDQRSFLKQYLVGFVMLGVLLSLTVLSSLVSIVSPAYLAGTLPIGRLLPWLVVVHASSYVFFPLLLFLTCYFCFRILPSHSLRNSCLLTGSLVSTLAIYLTREVFVWYTGHLGAYEMIYGSLTFIMLFTFWAYVVSIIILFGAEVAVALNSVLGAADSGNEY